MAYRVDEDHVAWRIVDGEAVIIHNESSIYYSLNRTGTYIWNGLTERAACVDDIVRGVSAHNGSAGEIATDVRDFLKQLVQEDLVVETEGDAPADPENAREPAGPYERPELAQFGELERLILSGE